ncbi:MAG: DUF3631 domain-containing protein [Actinobacteria bacterium]|nr:DUF3631 domain-containing protein [Actinomycetota bacterium]MBI3688569.1 DUF3631 domain-containing protein [Actinomycetota bacterium]
MSSKPTPTRPGGAGGIPSPTDTTANRDGALILDRLHATLTRYVILPSVEVTDAVVLWIAATHAQPAWAHAPRLVITAPQRRCGKSRLLDVLEATCHHPLITVNASPAAVYRSIGTDDPPTLLVDEADTIFGGKAAEAHEELRGLLNAGHQRNRPAIRYNAAANRVESISTFAMAALAGIGRMPDTIEDRAVIVPMRRRAPGETVHPYRWRRDGPRLRGLAEDLTGWLRTNLPVLEATEPTMPVEDRAADTWEPLIVVADLAGSDWPARARTAAVVLTGAAAESDALSLSTLLLADCRRAFGTEPVLSTEQLLTRLRDDPEGPWAELGPTGLTARRLGILLADYRIRSANARFPDGAQRKGFTRTDFTDAWTRYLPDDPEPVSGTDPSHPSHPHQPRSTRDGLMPWDGSTRPTTTTRPSLTSGNEGGTGGTGSRQQPVTCIRCRHPMAHDDGTHTHPACTGSTA